MSRVKDLQKYVHKVLKGMEDNQKKAAAIAHSHGCLSAINLEMITGRKTS